VALIQERDRLDSGHFKALAAAHVLAHDHIVAADHVRLSLGKLGAIAFVGAAGELLFLGPHQPCEFVLTGLAAVRAGKRVGFPGFLFVEKISLVHLTLLSTTKGPESTEKCRARVTCLRARRTILVHDQDKGLAVSYAIGTGVD
jgi:hypothetical protein